MIQRLFLSLLAGACLLHAQEYRSTMTGRITDQSGSAIPNAKVTAIQKDTNVRYPTVAGPEGFYTIPQLLPGAYQVEAEISGFKKYVQTGIELASGARVTVDIQLTVGSNSESITITDAAPSLLTASASAGQAITTREVENLPINGRAPMDLAVMAYGVVNTGTRDQNRAYENGGFSDFAMGGGVSGANEALIDGVPNVGTLGVSGRRAAFSPPVDGVSEVKVEVFNVDAAYGGAGGGTVEVITKGGGNAFHGSMSEFNQVSNLTATPFFTNAAGGKKTIFRQNLWGLTAGGPIFIPKVYDGRNRLFWFFTYEGTKNSEPAPTYTTVPTTAERGGDFSALLKVNNSYQLYDPTTAKLASGVVTRQPFANNIIPASQLNPVATAYLKYIDLPNFAGKSDGTNNYFAGLTTNNAYQSQSGRIDYSVSNNNKLTGSIRHSLWQQDSGNIFQNVALGESGIRDIWGGTIDDVHTFTPTMVGNLRAGFTRYRAYYNQNSNGFDPTQLGFPAYIAANSTHLLMPAFTFSDGFLTANPATNLHYSDQPSNTYQLFGSLTKIFGEHTVKVGGEHRVNDFSNLAWSGSTGAYTFDNSWVRANNTATGAPLGGSMSAFLLGLPSSGSYSINASSKNDALYDVIFLQDDWHVKPNLTINMGLRWEYNHPTVERWNRQSIGFDATATNAVTAAARAAYAKSPLAQLPASQFNPTGGLLFATPDNRTATNNPKNDFSPRLGISWSPSAMKGKTVLRTGLGMFDYVYGVILPQQPGFSYTNSYVATNDSFVTPAATLKNPFPNGLVQPPGSSQGLNTNLGQSITFLNPNLARQYSLRWTFDLQQQLTKDTTLQIGYIGNHSVHLTSSYNFGSLPAQYLSTSPFRDTATINALSAVVANPFAGLLPGQSNNGSTTSVSNLLRPFPAFSGVTEANMNNGGSYFHELGIRLARRMTKGLLVAANYGHSRLMEQVSYLNAGSLALEKRVSAGDRPNNFSFSALYQLPFGKGKRFGSNAKGVTNILIGDWAVSTLYTFHTGAPLAWGNVIYNGGSLQYDPRNVNHAFDTTRFNLVSAQQLSQNFRYFPSQFNNLRTDGTNNLNISVTKEFSLWEKMHLQFRADSFNAANHALFGAPNLTPTGTTFGVISTQTNTPRVIQGALRLTF